MPNVSSGPPILLVQPLIDQRDIVAGGRCLRTDRTGKFAGIGGKAGRQFPVADARSQHAKYLAQRIGIGENPLGCFATGHRARDDERFDQHRGGAGHFNYPDELRTLLGVGSCGVGCAAAIL